MTDDRTRWAILTMLRAEAHKNAIEAGATAEWEVRTATLTGSPDRGASRGLQISSLECGDQVGLLQRLARRPPDGPHILFAYVHDEHEPIDALLAVGYGTVEHAPVMARAISPGAVTASVAGEADRAALMSLDGRAARYRFDDPDVITLLLHDGHTLVAKTQLVLSEAPTAYLSELVVHPDRRRLGLGARLLAESERFAGSRGCDRMLLVSTRVGRPLYRAAGYETLVWVYLLAPTER